MKTMYKYSTHFLALLLIGSLVTFTGCEDDDPEVPNEEEVITDVVVTFTSSVADPVILTFIDRDGPGGMDGLPTQVGAFLPDTEYQGSIQFFDNTDPADSEDITLEVAEEDDEHQVFYTTTGGLNMTFAYDDADDDNNPIGLMTTLSTGASSSGDLTIVLRHEPAKDAAGVAIDNPAPAGGETDIEVEFAISF